MEKYNIPHNSQSHENYLLIFTTLAISEKPVTNSELKDALGFTKQYVYKKTKYLTKKGYLKSQFIESKELYGTTEAFTLSEKGKITYQLICNQFGTFIF